MAHKMADRVRGVVKAIVPPRVRGVVSELRSLTPPQRRHYWRSMLESAARSREPALPAGLTAGSRVIMVCFGNIFRSPMAEALLIRELARRGVEAHHVSSAGLSARTGRAAHDNAIVTAQSMGVSLHAHRARLLTKEIVADSDLIVVMDRMNVAILAERFPETRARAVLLGAFDPDVRRLGAVIADPYGKPLEDVTACYQRLERSVAALAERLLSASN